MADFKAKLTEMNAQKELDLSLRIRQETLVSAL